MIWAIGRLVALALGLGAHREDDLAGQVDLEVGRLPHRRAPALADRADPLRRARRRRPRCRSTGPTPRYLPRVPRLGLGLVELVVADHRQGLVEGRLVVARVDVDLRAVRRPSRGPTGCRTGTRPAAMKFLRRIAAGSMPDLVGEQVHRPLDDVGRLGPAGAAVGVDERRVRVDAGDLAVDVGDLVAARQDPAVERRRDARADRRQAAAEVGVRLDPEPGDLAVAACRRSRGR